MSETHEVAALVTVRANQEGEWLILSNGARMSLRGLVELAPHTGKPFMDWARAQLANPAPVKDALAIVEMIEELTAARSGEHLFVR